MTPILAPVSMLSGKGSGAAIFVVVALLGLVMYANQQKPTIKTNN